MHYYKRNLGDYAKKAGRLSMLQHGSYTLLIDACYDREQFPTLEDAIEWTWASTAEEIEAVHFVLRKFFTLEDGRYVQSRVKEEIAEYHTKAETNKRIALDRETKRKANGTNRARSVDEPPPNHKPITTNHKPITNDLLGTFVPSETEDEDGDDDDEKPSDRVDPKFLMAWGRYPKRAGNNPRNRALSCWAARLKEGYLADELIAAVERYAAHCKADGSVGTRFVMQSQTFFGPDKAFLRDWATAAPEIAPEAVAVPEWVPKQAWHGFLAMRSTIRKPVIAESVPLAIQKLQQLRDAGHDPRAVLEQSTLNSWAGLFEIKASSATAEPQKQDWI